MPAAKLRWCRMSKLGELSELAFNKQTKFYTSGLRVGVVLLLFFSFDHLLTVTKHVTHFQLEEF